MNATTLASPELIPVRVAGCDLKLGLDGVLRCAVTNVVSDDLGALRDFLRALVRTGGGPGTPVLVEVMRPAHMSQVERLVYLASTEAAALAVVALDPRLAGKLARLASAQCPARVCENRLDAELWLAGYVSAPGG
jgi:hypothetical protein